MKKTIGFAAAAGVVLFSVLAGTGAANAYWNSEVTAGSSIAAGSLAISESGFSALTAAFSPSALVVTHPVTITNSGTMTAPYSFALGTTSSTGLYNAVTLHAWTVSSATACASSTSTPGTSTAYTWHTVPALTGSLVSKASVVYCLRASLTAAQLAQNPSATMPVTFALSSTIGNWSASAQSVTAIESVAADTTAPSVPTALRASSTTNTATRLDWTASTDDYGVVAYDVYRGTVKVGSTTSTGYSDSGLTPGTSYSYTVKARDAAGHSSAASQAVTVTTAVLDPSQRYRVTNPDNHLCLADWAFGTTNGSSLVIDNCIGARTSQAWKFTPLGNGYYSVLGEYAPSLGWDVDIDASPAGGLSDYTRVQLWSYGGGSNEQWQLVSEGGTNYHFVNHNSLKCLDINGRTTVVGTNLQQYTCNATPAQSFSITPFS